MIQDIGRDSGQGNFLGVQLSISAEDFRSELSFARLIDQALAPAGRRIGPQTVILFPEMTGLFLAFADEWPWVYRSSSLPQAVGRAFTSAKAILLLRALLLERSQGAEHLAGQTFLRAKAQLMARVYNDVLAEAAIRTRATIVGGSIVLPEPTVVSGRLVPSTARNAPLRNVTALYGPDGAVREPIVVKRQPTRLEAEALGVQGLPGSSVEFETPAGPIAPIICADAWYDESYRGLRPQTTVLVPGFLAVADAWGAPWRGYDCVGEPPAEAALTNEGLTEGAAWRRYAAPGRWAGPSLTVFARGALWGLRPDGAPLVHMSGETWAPGTAGWRRGLVNVWRPASVSSPWTW